MWPENTWIHHHSPNIVQSLKLVYISFESSRAALQNVVFARPPWPWPILSDFCWENGQWADSGSYALPSFMMKIAFFDQVATGTKKVPDRSTYISIESWESCELRLIISGHGKLPVRKKIPWTDTSAYAPPSSSHVDRLTSRLDRIVDRSLLHD